MNEEEKALLIETAELARKNNKILRGMQREANVGKLFHSLKWLVIIAVTVWSYFLIQPYLKQIQSIYTSVQGAQQSVTDLQGKMQIDTSQFENFLKSFKVEN